MGDRRAPATYFEKSLVLAPDNAEALNYLGYMWAEQGENLKRARELIERALKSEPDNDAFLDSMGWVLFKQGDAKAALGYLLQAITKSKKPDATLYDHLGDVYAALKEMDKAREAWAKSLELEPSEVVQKKLSPAAQTP
jgi:tetratricopeptide (TPR) repeat protein